MQHWRNGGLGEWWYADHFAELVGGVGDGEWLGGNGESESFADGFPSVAGCPFEEPVGWYLGADGVVVSREGVRHRCGVVESVAVEVAVGGPRGEFRRPCCGSRRGCRAALVVVAGRCGRRGGGRLVGSRVAPRPGALARPG